jgi:toxin ParE1/3/4
VRSLPVEFTAQARRDLARIRRFIAEQSAAPQIADRFIDRLEVRCCAIGELPEGSPVREGLRRGTRLVRFEKAAMIAYVIENDIVVIARIYYRGRDYLRLLRK